MKRFVFLFVVLTLLCIFVGCSANGDSEDTVPFDGVYLSGKILFNGMPLPDTDVLVNGLIVFSTDDDGTFYLGPLEKGDVITFFKDGYSFAPSSVTADGSDSYLIISACLAGAVCGDHCSPISDTTIMSSAGAQCNHVNHVTTQFPYAFTVAAVSFVSFIIAGFVQNAWIMLPIAIVLLVLTVFGIKYVTGKIKSK